MTRFLSIYFFSLLIGFQAFAAESASPLKTFENSSDVTLIHIVRPHFTERWQKTFLRKYIDSKGPPTEWFQVGAYGGVMVMAVPRVERLDLLTTEDIVKMSFFKNMTGGYQDLLENSIFILMNPESNAIWLSGSRSDAAYKKINWTWYLNPLNYFRKNLFSAEFVKGIKRDWHMPFVHSGIYEDYNIIGHSYESSGRADGLRMLTGVITNPKMIAISRLIVPQKISILGKQVDLNSQRKRLSDSEKVVSPGLAGTKIKSCNKVHL